jgi:hypothetical protein
MKAVRCRGTVVAVIGLSVRVYHYFQRAHRPDKPISLVAAC